jgi:radical SAM protein with 4Fe4S-binding SPASM domain
MPNGMVAPCEGFGFKGKECANLHDPDAFRLLMQHWRLNAAVFRNDCLSCPCLMTCGGGCSYDAWCESGSIDRCSDYHRRYACSMLEWQIWDLYDHMTVHPSSPFSITTPTTWDRATILRGHHNAHAQPSWR